MSFLPYCVQMLAAGEESGRIEDTLKKVAQHYDREIPAAIKRAFTVIEPLGLGCYGRIGCVYCFSDFAADL